MKWHWNNLASSRKFLGRYLIWITTTYWNISKFTDKFGHISWVSKIIWLLRPLITFPENPEQNDQKSENLKNVVFHRPLLGVGTGLARPSLRTVRAVFPHTALQSAVFFIKTGTLIIRLRIRWESDFREADPLSTFTPLPRATGILIMLSDTFPTSRCWPLSVV